MAYNGPHFVNADTKWVKLWADWPTLEPVSGVYDSGAWARLDAEVNAARAYGLAVMITIYRYPPWSSPQNQAEYGLPTQLVDGHFYVFPRCCSR